MLKHFLAAFLKALPFPYSSVAPARVMLMIPIKTQNHAVIRLAGGYPLLLPSNGHHLLFPDIESINLGFRGGFVKTLLIAVDHFFGNHAIKPIR